MDLDVALPPLPQPLPTVGHFDPRPIHGDHYLFPLPELVAQIWIEFQLGDAQGQGAVVRSGDGNQPI